MAPTTVRRSVFFLASLTLVVACGSDPKRPASIDDDTPSGGGASTSPKDAGDDVGGGQTDADTDASRDSGSDVSCSVDPPHRMGDDYCVLVGADPYGCNPITSLPCDVASGEVCDFDGDVFRCLNWPGTRVPPCGVCGAPNPQLCSSGYTCMGLGSKCTRYCCDDLQCAAGTSCVIQGPTVIGICQATRDDLLSTIAVEPDGGVVDQPDPTEPACGFMGSLGNGSCVDLGSEVFACNPFSTGGCGTDRVCELVGGRWQCIDALAFVGICEVCTVGSCRTGSTCTATFGCLRNCCVDADCMPGLCFRPSAGSVVGVCMSRPTGP